MNNYWQHFVDFMMQLETQNSVACSLAHVQLPNPMLLQEIKQFPQRLAATAWHLADNARCKIAGFSGKRAGIGGRTILRACIAVLKECLVLITLVMTITSLKLY